MGTKFAEFKRLNPAESMALEYRSENFRSFYSAKFKMYCTQFPLLHSFVSHKTEIKNPNFIDIIFNINTAPPKLTVTAAGFRGSGQFSDI